MLKNVMLSAGGELDARIHIGAQVLFTIPDKGVVTERLTNLWQSEGLDQGLIPDRRTAVNTAEYACRSVETRRSRTADGGRLTVKVDRVETSATCCTYQLTRQVLDAANKVIDHEKGMTITFDATLHAQGQDPWSVRPFEPEHYLVMRDLEQTIRDHFTAHVGMVPGQKVRNAVREYLTRKDKLGGTNMRRKSGGVYFIPVEHKATLQSLERVVKSLYEDDADFDLIPMANSDGVRSIIEKHHALNVKEEAAELAARIRDRLKDGGTPRKDFVANIVAERRALGQHKQKMDDLLGQTGAQVDVALEMIDEQLGKLLGL